MRRAHESSSIKMAREGGIRAKHPFSLLFDDDNNDDTRKKKKIFFVQKRIVFIFYTHTWLVGLTSLTLMMRRRKRIGYEVKCKMVVFYKFFILF